MKSFFVKYHPVPSIASGLFIFLLCLLPGAALPDAGWAAALQPDKWVHAMLYFGWMLVYVYSGGKSKAKAFVLMLLFGGAVELFQQYVLHYRSGEWLDWLADGVGLVVGLRMTAKRLSR